MGVRGVANEQNLRPLKKGELSSEEAKKRGRAGGIACQRKKAERKSMAETLEMLMKMPMKDGPVESVSGMESAESMKGRNVTMGDKLMVTVMTKALKGDMKAVEFIRDMLGEMPKSSKGSELADFATQLQKLAASKTSEDTEGWEEK